ncbi:hypothetical protein [Roseovarius sp.]|mgnify:CR=1 FL=1|uniref:hypothetical protein n=1 Tax=Roseovarius sp. TaxID=1486281 RepID=UPI003B59213E
MNEEISTLYDSHLDCVVVRFPSHVTERQLRKWTSDLHGVLLADQVVESDLLMDTNRHDFENTNCLKLLRDTLMNDKVVLRAIRRVAFVQPKAIREPHVVSDTEAYFCTFEDAQNALRKSRSFSADG